MLVVSKDKSSVPAAVHVVAHLPAGGQRLLGRVGVHHGDAGRGRLRICVRRSRAAVRQRDRYARAYGPRSADRHPSAARASVL